MAYVAVDKDGNETVFYDKPIRAKSGLPEWVPETCKNFWIGLPKGSIEKLIGRKLTWEDEPVELKEENS